MCEPNQTVPCWLKIAGDLSSTGEEKWRFIEIDSCIAPIVRALQDYGIDMRGSCCGHGKCFGEINLQDGRTLVIIPKEVFNIPYDVSWPELFENIKQGEKNEKEKP